MNGYPPNVEHALSNVRAYYDQWRALSEAESSAIRSGQWMHVDRIQESPLEGAHAQTACRACHLYLVLSEVVVTCVSCHQDAHRGELGDDCAPCHTPRSFIDRARMARGHQFTRFPLVGAHRVTDCEACHIAPTLQVNLIWVNISAECSTCHFDDYQAATDPTIRRWISHRAGRPVTRPSPSSPRASSIMTAGTSRSTRERIARSAPRAPTAT